MSLHNGAFRCAITAGPCLNSSIVSGLPIKPSWLRSFNVAERGSHFRRLTEMVFMRKRQFQQVCGR